MTPGDGKEYRRLCLHLSIILRAGVDYFLRLPIRELTETTKEATKIIGSRRRKRV